ncbi:BTB/POZ domain-containing protein At1g21780 isoform X1 [Selaginella moellendorffii]|uniref:BTB/POZ domain-containing protein At1g21780 isoform X1 n=1 Tax=Selaginella moellendorffii TaxID=88036 RepID=UPI000D1CCF37|nr:BTB/POZ domain-containing protein At1g21780 isoform X1 [Selaginella moellendorffii]|eukprot:XP_024523274.1 BTB/POZ domain-containing protein At1g21780 isoform X1 [Selaginella moellendorffii]
MQSQPSQIHLTFSLNVEILSRLAQWRIDSLTPNLCWKSNNFKMGVWTWRLQIKKCGPLHVWLFKEHSDHPSEQVPTVAFVLRVLHGPGLRQVVQSQVNDKTFLTNEYHAWSVETAIHGKFVVEVEFIDMKCGSQAVSFSLEHHQHRSQSRKSIQPAAHQAALSCLSYMLDSGVHTDVTITTPSGSIGAHLAILATRSRVFQVMFSHDLRERKTFTIEMEDMSLESLKALLAYLYGSINRPAFHKHRMALLAASDKYDIEDLKQACEESLMEDINSDNVLERLHNAWMFHLPNLKKDCMRYLFEFGKIHDIRANFDQFLHSTDKELLIEMFQEGLNAVHF